MEIGRVKKLVPNLKDKKIYVVHIQNLNQTLKHGLKLKKVHQLIRLKSSCWMKLFIMVNTTKLRIAAKNEFEQRYYIGFFGLRKTFLSLRTIAFLERPWTILGTNPFSNELFTVEMGKTEIKIMCTTKGGGRGRRPLPFCVLILKKRP